MATEVFGEYTAFDTRGGVRFQKNGKMTSENAIPPEVVIYLKNKLATQPQNPEAQPAPKFPMPTEEQKAQMRAESLKVKPELQLTPEEEAQRAITGVPDNEVPLQPDDFDAPDSDGNEPLPRTVEPMALPGQFPVPEVETPAETPLTSDVDPSFLETVSIHTAPLEAIAQALYDRFGVYTIWLNMLPQTDEVNPLTGEPFTKYHQGIAYQSAIAAHARGLQDPSRYKQGMTEGRDASANVQDSFVTPARTLADARRQDSFAFRTSVSSSQTQAASRIEHVRGEDGLMHAIQVPVPVQEHGGTAPSRYDNDEEEQVLEPPIFGTKPIIKPSW